METYTGLKGFVSNPFFEDEKQKLFDLLKKENEEYKIDPQIRHMIKVINRLSFCFTLQCCYGHFVNSNGRQTDCLELLKEVTSEENIVYKIAYIAICLKENDQGKKLYTGLKHIADLDPEHIQFGCADWFWKQQVNSFILQVEPEQFKYQDTAVLTYEEAIHIETVRDRFFHHLNALFCEEG